MRISTIISEMVSVKQPHANQNIHKPLRLLRARVSIVNAPVALNDLKEPKDSPAMSADEW